eukprot:982746-Pleurochrysis_carterae.AAC.4
MGGAKLGSGLLATRRRVLRAGSGRSGLIASCIEKRVAEDGLAGKLRGQGRAYLSSLCVRVHDKHMRTIPGPSKEAQ